MIMTKSFGNNLKIIREERGLSQTELGAIVGTSKQVISRYEINQRSPKVSTVAEYAKKLGVPISRLTGWQKPEDAGLVIPPVLNGVQVAFSGGAGEGLEQADIDALVTIAERMKKNRDDRA
ncbi:MAG: helix-turn-helix domain-containing protein [Dehalococcoidia bacterium]|nr:helix-turn-helix domain-containing protein [Dehalococcoidia bacterium]